MPDKALMKGAIKKSEGHRRYNMNNTVKDLSKETKKSSGNGKEQKKPVDRKPVSGKDEAKKPGFKIEPEVVKLEPKPLTMDEKLQKLTDLNDLVEKRGRLTVSKSKLNSFDLKKEDHSTSITLRDQSGNMFVTSNTAAVNAFISSTRQVIQDELDNVENKIQF